MLHLFVRFGSHGTQSTSRYVSGALVIALLSVLCVVGFGARASQADESGTVPQQYDCPANNKFTWEGNKGQGAEDDNVSVFVGGNFQAEAGAAESEGVQVILGNATYSKNGTFNVGTVGVGSGIWPRAGSVMLHVGGDLTLGPGAGLDVGFGIPGGGRVNVGGKVNTGNVGGKVNTGEITLNGASAEPTSGMGKEGATAPYADFLTPLKTLSQSLAGAPQQEVVLQPRESGTLALKLNVDGTNAVQHFSIGAEVMEKVSAIMVVTEVEDATALPPIAISVRGAGDVTLKPNIYFALDGHQAFNQGGGLDYFTRLAPNIIWNFPEATAVKLPGGDQFIGSILAPFASVTLEASLNGRLYVGGDLTMAGSGNEIHAYPWTGSVHTECSPPKSEVDGVSEPPVSLLVEKVAQGTLEPLSGAEFSLFDEDGGVPPGASMEGKALGSFQVDGLAAGETYCLDETQAPIGYQTLASDVCFSVDAAGNPTLRDPDLQPMVTVSGRTLRIADAPALQVMPESGGMVTAWSAITLVIALGGIVVLGRAWVVRDGMQAARYGTPKHSRS